MRGFGKRIGILALCLVLCCTLFIPASAAFSESCPGSCAHAAAVGTTHYDTLEEALAAAPSGSTVKLLTDTAVTTAVNLDKTLTLDLGGKTLSADSAGAFALQFSQGGILRNGNILAVRGCAVQINGCNVTIEKDAKLESCGTAPAVMVTASKDNAAMLKMSGSLSGKDSAPLLHVEAAEGICNVQILKDAQLTAEENAAIFFASSGKLEILDGKILGKKDLIAVSIKEKQETLICVAGGELLSQTGEAIVITAGENAVVPADFVTGGTFRKVPAAYIPDYCKIRDNGNDTFTVISSYKVTFQPGSGNGVLWGTSVRCGTSLTLPKNSFAPPAGMDFAGWQIGGETYAAGDTYTPTEDFTVTALWKTHQHTGGKATCLKKAVCETCGETYGNLGSHSLTYVSGYAPSCTKSGVSAHSECSICGNWFSDGVALSESVFSIPALGHSWEDVEGQPATCTEDGLKAHQACSTCQQLQLEGSPVTAEDLILPAAGHTLETVAASEASCSQPGTLAHEHCTVCDKQFLQGEQITDAQLTTATAAHVLSDWISDQHYHWKACVDCQEVFRQGSHTDTDADGLCQECGYQMAVPQAEEVEESGFSWLFLLPVIAAVGIAVVLVLKKRK